tara:strand:- start:530 stop:952 length:423 start_codon:yes stop_codon:yes gene_type:complete
VNRKVRSATARQHSVVQHLMCYFYIITHPAEWRQAQDLIRRLERSASTHYANAYASLHLRLDLTGFADVFCPDYKPQWKPLTGQSEHFLSPQYDLLGQCWRQTEHVPMTLGFDLARTTSVWVTPLAPKPEQRSQALKAAL